MKVVREDSVCNQIPMKIHSFIPYVARAIIVQSLDETWHPVIKLESPRGDYPFQNHAVSKRGRVDGEDRRRSRREIPRWSALSPRFFFLPRNESLHSTLFIVPSRDHEISNIPPRSPAGASSYILIASPPQLAPLSPRVHFTSPLYCFANNGS